MTDTKREGNTDGQNVRILIGSFDESPFIKHLVKSKKLDARELKGKNEKFIITTVKDPIEGFPELERNEVLDFNDKILDIAKMVDPLEVFTQMQNYLEALLKSNLDNMALKVKLISDIKAVETAKKEYRLNINIQTIIETLSFKLIL